MRVFLRRAACALLSICLLASACFAAEDGFPDLSGHWAEAALRQAVSDGLLSGFEDGTMRPNDPITKAQMLAVLCRVLRARPAAEPESLGLTGEEWYADAALGAAALGLIDNADGVTAPMTRGDALTLLCRALGLSRAEPDRSVLGAYAEADAPDEIAALVALGLVQGYQGSLNLSGAISRGEFVAVLYRAMGDAVPAGAEVPGELADQDFPDGLWFGFDCETVSLSGVTAPSAVVCAQTLKSLRLSKNTRLERLVLACGGDLSPAITGGSRVETLVVAQGEGTVTVSGGAQRLELTGSGRTLVVAGSLKELVVTGENCAVTLRGGVSVETLRVLGSGCTVRNDGGIQSLTIDGASCTLEGYGSIRETTLNTIFSQPPQRPGTLTDNRDFGLEGAALTVTAPAELPLGAALEAEAVVTLPEKTLGKPAQLCWYLGGQLLAEEAVTLGEDEQRFALSAPPEYSRDMPARAAVRVTLSYQGAEAGQCLEAESTELAIENHPADYYRQQDEARVLALVDTGYEGDYTLAWAEAHDYDAADKAAWVNAKGYASDTEYLIWISLKYQRCNIFQGQAGAWELVRSGIVGTGAPGSGTPVGVWKTTYKQELGWTTATYTVKPVVRFKGGGYAFHSRLYWPGTATVSDASIGFPVSHGCVRMYDEDVQWIFDNIPKDTTVVVF